MTAPRVRTIPDLDEEISDLRERLGRLERRLGDDPTVIDPAHVYGTFPGVLVPGMVTTPLEHPMGGRLVSVRCKLGAVATTGAGLTLTFRKNGSVVTPVQSAGADEGDDGEAIPGTFWAIENEARILAGKRSATMFFQGLRFAPLIDDLTIEIAAVEGVATSLTTRTDWAL